jgi:hypothetical protein
MAGAKTAGPALGGSTAAKPGPLSRPPPLQRAMWSKRRSRNQPRARGEHDLGAFEAEGHMIFFKIDYYDKSHTYHSPDAADPFVTERVITIMLAEEY